LTLSAEILVIRFAIYHGLKKVETAGRGRKAADGMESEGAGEFVELAYAPGRAESIHAAHTILTRAASLHPTDATIQFNLVCYEAQLGNLDRAKAQLK